MATTTARLRLRKPTRDDLISVLQDLDGNYDAIDAAMGATICTSTTRPSQPYAGQLIYETDTGFEYIWNAAWVLVSANPFPGMRAFANTAAVVSPVTNQVIYDLSDKNLKMWTGTAWQIIYPGFGSWLSLPKNNGWTNFDPTLLPASYRKAPGNKVEIIGKMSSGVTDNGTIIATLPVGFRPPAEQMMVAGTSTGNSLNLSVKPDGTISISNVNAAPTVILMNGSIVLSLA